MLSRCDSSGLLLPGSATAYYNFVWRTRKPDEGNYRLPAPMAAGVVETLMSFEDLFDAVMGEGYAMAA